MVGSTTVDGLTPSDAGRGANRASARACEYDLNVFLKGQNVQHHVLAPEAFHRMLGVSPDHLKLGSRVHITRLCAEEKFWGLHENR